MITGYESIATLLGVPIELIVIVITIITIWELIWKGIALWKCGRNNQPIWFVFILLINSIGILPILYLLFFQKKTVKPKVVLKKKRRK